MARITRSILDPVLFPLVQPLYRLLHIPKKLPPEAIIAIGHSFAIIGAAGFTLVPLFWWTGIFAALGVLANHLADMVDGAHARATGQCRNGGELLDHFTDPLSFSYWMVGLGIATSLATGSPWIGLGFAIACVICIYATAVLTNIRAKITGSFELARFGPTEFKALLTTIALGLSLIMLWQPDSLPMLLVSLQTLLAVVGITQLALGLIKGVRAVNLSAKPADTTPWIVSDS